MTRIRISRNANFAKVLGRIKSYCEGRYDPTTKTWLVPTAKLIHLRVSDYEEVAS
jgi:hypothetical protein